MPKITTPFDRKKAERHVKKLARELGVKQVFFEYAIWRYEIWCYEHDSHVVFGRPIRGMCSYAGWLHELGHVASHHRHTTVPREYAAWAWARRKCLWDFTPRVERMVAKCLLEYAVHSETNKKAGKGR